MKKDSLPVVVPFGKYKGQTAEAMRHDKQYVEWLTSQEWFPQKHPNLYTLIINNFGEPSETPEHNQMQVKFLEETFQLKLSYFLLGNKLFEFDQAYFDNLMVKFIDLLRAGVQRKINEFKKRLNEPSRFDFNLYNKEKYDQDISKVQNKISDIKQKFIELDNQAMLFFDKVEFEKHGVDVLYSVSYGLCSAYEGFLTDFVSKEELQKHGLPREWNHCNRSVRLSIELKPIVGDDFPSVLRQMKANRSRILVIGSYTGVGATRQQFIDFFNSQHIQVVFESDIDKLELPEFVEVLRINYDRAALDEIGTI